MSLNETNQIHSKIQKIQFQHKITPANSHSELIQFLKRIEHHNHSWLDQPYNAYKSKVQTYRMTFLGFSLLFLSLGLFIFFKHPNWIFHQVLWNTHFIKYLVFGFSWGLSFVSGYIAWNMRTEKEVLNLFANRARKALSKKHHRFSEPYRHGVDAIDQTKEEYQILLQRIAKASDLEEKERETLFNQTLLRFKEIASS